jgi:hypothetical protein
MMALFIWFAQEETVSVQEAMKDLSIDFRYLITLGSMFLVSLGVFIWAAFFRKPGRHRRHHSHRHPPASPLEPKPESRKRGWFFFFRKRHHRRRRQERPRNPTLAEAGGLPPIRTPAPPTSM